MKDFKKNRLEDMKILISLGESYQAGTPFRIIFSTEGSFSRKNYICSYEKNVYKNCQKADDKHILCLLDKHGLDTGYLQAQVMMWVEDDSMPDGDLQLVSKEKVSIEDEEGKKRYILLTNEKSDTLPLKEIQIEILQNFVKGDKGEKGERGETGPQGPRGPVGSVYAEFEEVYSGSNNYVCILPANAAAAIIDGDNQTITL